MAGYTETAGNVDWCTPQNIIDAVKQSFSTGTIELDPCSNEHSIVGARVNYILPKNDGLMDSWDYKTIYVNPPYGKSYMHKETKAILAAKEYQKLSKEEKEAYSASSMWDWMARCSNASGLGNEVIALIPATVDTKTWQDIIFPTARAICFIRGRVRFNGAPASAPMPVCLVYWHTGGEYFEDKLYPYRFVKACENLGQVVVLR